MRLWVILSFLAGSATRSMPANQTSANFTFVSSSAGDMFATAGTVCPVNTFISGGACVPCGANTFSNPGSSACQAGITNPMGYIKNPVWDTVSNSYSANCPAASYVCGFNYQNLFAYFFYCCASEGAQVGHWRISNGNFNGASSGVFYTATNTDYPPSPFDASSTYNVFQYGISRFTWDWGGCRIYSNQVLMYTIGNGGYSDSICPTGKIATGFHGWWGANMDQASLICNALFIPCQPGTYALSPSATSCLSCAAGSYSTATGLSDVEEAKGIVYSSYSTHSSYGCDRPQLDADGAWCTGIVGGGSTQIDFGQIRRIRGFVTQGRKDAPQWVTEYMTFYSNDNYAWNYFPNNVYVGNSDSNTRKYNYVTVNGAYSSILARYVKLGLSRSTSFNGYFSVRWNVLVRPLTFAVAGASEDFSPCMTGPAGSYITSSAATAYSLCSPGTYSAAGATACTACVDGTYSSLLGASACAVRPDCPANTFRSGATISQLGTCLDCARCGVGQFLGGCPGGKSTDSGSCYGCINGQYSAGGFTRACTNCQAGKYSEGQVATCIDCSPGKYATTQGASACNPCAAGTYSSTSGSAVCTMCGAGTYSSALGLGTATCTMCGAGTYSSALGLVTATCTMCGAGTYSSALGLGTTSSNNYPCRQCATGTYSTAEGLRTACLPCQLQCPMPGQYSSCGNGTAGNCSRCSNTPYQTQYFAMPDAVADSRYNPECPLKRAPVGYFRNLTTNPRAPMWVAAPPAVFGAWCAYRNDVNQQPYYFCSKSGIHLWWQNTRWVGSPVFSDVGTNSFIISGPSPDSGSEPIEALITADVLVEGVNWVSICPLGTYGSYEGATSCLMTPIGFHSPSAGTSYYIICPNGTHSSAEGASHLQVTQGSNT